MINSLKIILVFTLVSFASCKEIKTDAIIPESAQAVWQWSITLDGFVSKETNKNPEGYLWIPENCEKVRGIVFAQNNMVEQGILEDFEFRKTLNDLGFAEVWVSPMFSQSFDFNSKDPELFQNLMNNLADISGYSELSTAPIIPIGHSALATFPWNFAVSFPEKTIAIISVHGDAPQTHLTGYGGENIDWSERNIDGIPGLFIMGEYEWWEDRLAPGLRYQQENPQSVITWFADAGHGHFDYSKMLINYLSKYIGKAVNNRLLDDGQLKPIKPESGWLMDRWYKDEKPKISAAPFGVYKGDRATASWVFDQEMAEVTESYYANARGKKEQYIGLVQENDTIVPHGNHAQYKLKFIPNQDGVTFKIKPFFSDSTKLNAASKHASTPLEMDVITGPAKKLNDSTFKIHFDRLGFDNTKRSNHIWLIAHNDGDAVFKSAVQQMEMVFPLVNSTGIPQTINFPPIDNASIKTKHIPLKAKSSSGLDVSYYVKSGPAFIEGSTLFIAEIPKRAKFPIKVTVVGWQYGVSPNWKSATPVERTFYINKF